MVQALPEMNKMELEKIKWKHSTAITKYISNPMKLIGMKNFK